jgi:hypothetical protein
MFSQTYYLVRSRADGKYLVAHLKGRSDSKEAPEQGYLLVFKEHFEALSYLNTHAQDLADRFGVESIPGSQLESLLKRWDFNGVGVVQDPLLPKVEFLAR